MRPAALMLLLPSLALAAPAVPTRTPQARQAAIDLAYVLGETHALRQACLGEGDQEWRTQMTRLVETEEMDPTLGEAGKRRLAAAFNAGFAARQAQFRGCRPEVQAELDRTAAKGEALARRLAGSSPP